MKPKAFLFDLDGVLTDTAHFHFLAWKAIADKLGLHFDKAANEQLKGVSRERSFEIILKQNSAQTRFSEAEKKFYANEKNELYKTLILSLTPADILPGVTEFLAAAKQNGILLAVASASKNADTVLKQLEIREVFDYVADATLISRAKPHPEIFLNCAEALHVAPTQCVAFEDAQAGIEAIHAAGMLSVGIGVSVTSLAPDLALASTRELALQLFIPAGI